MYVNIPNLEAILSKYDPTSDRVYLGRWPLGVEQLNVPDLHLGEDFLNCVSRRYYWKHVLIDVGVVEKRNISLCNWGSLLHQQFAHDGGGEISEVK